MIYLVRHGQTQLGAEGRFQGCKEDYPLNELGKQQARRLGNALPFLPICSSPLKRARMTADLSTYGANVIVFESLRDVDVGSLGGKTPEEASKLFPKFYRQWINHEAYVLPDGESPEHILERVKLALGQLPRDAVVVSHEGIIRFMLCELLGLSGSFFPKFRIEEASISVVEDGQLIRLNDTSHLRGFPVCPY